MKYFFIIILVINTCFHVNAQITIGSQTTIPTPKESVILDFVEGENKGIILPYVRVMPSGENLVEGTILLNATDPTNAKIEYYNGSWQDLSNSHTANIQTYLSNQPTEVKNVESKVIIGAKTTSADGILVLESDSKALVLPKVNSVNDIINPAPGMMVLLNNSSTKMLAVFNGKIWTFWEP